MKDITTLGIDLAKNVFQLHGINKQGQVVYKCKIKRNNLVKTLANMKKCLIGMEACGGAHYWARKFTALGHQVKMMSPQYVKPYIKTNKSDSNDAEGICEAVTRPSMRFVPPKTVEQQDIQMLHRVRSRLLAERISLSNQIRGLLHEYGVVIPRGAKALKTCLPVILADESNELSWMGRNLFQELYADYLSLQEKINHYDTKIEDLAKSDERCVRLMSEPGIGAKTATALLAAIGNAEVFQNSRQLSAWLGLVPKQSSSGEKVRLLGISKRGDKYLRSLLVHGARSIVNIAGKKKDRYSVWIQKLLKRSEYNKVVVAVANKNARIAWALLTRKTCYEKNYETGNA